MISPAPGDPASPDRSCVAMVPARSVTLADGRRWGLARPTPRYRPEATPCLDAQGRAAETIQLMTRVGYPAAIERLVIDLRVACEAPRGPAADGRRLEALMTLAAALLRRAHDLEPAAAAALLDLDDVPLTDLVDAIVALVGGVGLPTAPEPAPSALGGDDARTPRPGS